MTVLVLEWGVMLSQHDGVCFGVGCHVRSNMASLLWRRPSCWVEHDGVRCCLGRHVKFNMTETVVDQHVMLF